jgi:hypothetical protein
MSCAIAFSGTTSRLRLNRLGGCYMKKIRYSKDVDALLIELSDDEIAYAEDEGRVILHYSNNEKLVLIEILDFKQFMSDDIIAELISTP